MRDVAKHGASGVYTVLYDGDGVLSFNMNAARVWRPRPGRVDVLVRLSMQGNNGLCLSIERTNPLDPVRNIRVYTPGFEEGRGFQGSPFHPALLATIRLGLPPAASRRGSEGGARRCEAARAGRAAGP